MAKQDNTWLFVILIIIVLFLFFNNGGLSQNVNIDNGESEQSSSSNNQQNQQQSQTQQDYCYSYTQNYPTYFFVRELQCEAAGGEYICEPSRMGCYDITTWDYVTMCGSAEVQLLKAFCATLSGDWTCTATEVSCER